MCVGPSGPWLERLRVKLQDVGLTSEVVWRIEKGTLIREETLSSKQPVSIRRWRLAVPTTHDQVETEMC